MAEPRCALLLYGLPKFFRERSYPSLVAHVVARMRSPVDVFVHTYDLRATTNPRNHEHDCALDPDEVFDARPVAWQVDTQARIDAETAPLFEELKAYGDAWQNGFISLRNALRQYHSINCAHALMDAHVRATGARPYATVIASRMDMLYLDDLDASLDGALHLAHDSVCIPDFHESGGFNDRFAIGGTDAMRSYCVDRLRWTVPFCQASGRPMHSESFIAWRLTRPLESLHVRKMRFRLRRIRANGHVHDADLLAT